MDDEIERRRAAAAFATADARLSGYIFDDEFKAEIDRFVAGELTTAQMRERVFTRYDLTRNS